LRNAFHAFGLDALPSIVMLDRTGKVFKKHVGFDPVQVLGYEVLTKNSLNQQLGPHYGSMTGYFLLLSALARLIISFPADLSVLKGWCLIQHYSSATDRRFRSDTDRRAALKKYKTLKRQMSADLLFFVIN